MKPIKLFIPLFSALLMLSACASEPIKLADKYTNLDSQLEQVSNISRFNLMSWETIDNQSLILQTSPDSFYLILLRRPAYDLMFTETIAVSNTGNLVKPGYDRVTVFGPMQREDYVIHKIFKLKNRETATQIRDQLS